MTIRFQLLTVLIILILFIGCSNSTTDSEPRVATPEFSITDGIYVVPQTVEIICETEGAEIRYTTDESNPNISSTLYTGPLEISEDTLLKAKGFKEGWNSSETATLNIIIEEDFEIGSIEFIDFPDTLQLQTTLPVKVALYDTEENPVPDGLVVTFTADKGYFEGNNQAITTGGEAEVIYNSGIIAGTLTMRARVGDILETAIASIVPALPAEISLTMEYKNPDEEWEEVTTPEFPVDYDLELRLKALLQDQYSNPTPDIGLVFSTNIGEIESHGITGDDGLAFAIFQPGSTVGEGIITVNTEEPGAEGEILSAEYDFHVYSDEIYTLTFTEDEYALDVTGVGGLESIPLQVELRDYLGDPVPGDDWIRLEISFEESEPDLYFENQEQNIDVQASEGIASVSLFSGTVSGSALLKASLLDNQEISDTREVIVRPGPAHNVEFIIGSYDTGENLGGGRWEIDAWLYILDIHDNPAVEDGTLVTFSLGDDPTPPSDCFITASALIENGYATTNISYHGLDTFSQILVRSEVNELAHDELVKLPVQFPQLEFYAIGSHVDFFTDSGEDASAQVEFHVNVIDGQGNIITNGRLLCTSPFGQFEYYEWFDDDDNPINEPHQHPDPYYITSYHGLARGYIRVWIWECPPPGEDDHVSEQEVEITVHLEDSDASVSGIIVIRRYNFPEPQVRRS